ncbi:MAG: NAD(P)/FAD-dependent oxidoreductase [Treponema sp.]|nr:NAD(P)/FAD-dependent oxidoreductase [Treponema sp.]
MRQGELFETTAGRDILVVGAGPAGLFAALAAAECGARVLVCEKMSSPGIKLLASGSGRCNITHAGAIEDFIPHYGAGQGRFLKHALFSFDNLALEAWFTRRGLPLAADERGKLFPATGRARDVLAVLLAEAGSAGVEIRGDARVLSARRLGGGFEVETSEGRHAADRLILSTGGKSYPGTGSSGEGYALAASFGHQIAPTRPALAPLVTVGGLPAACAGISIPEAEIVVRRGQKRVLRARGDLLFTHKGISGPVVLDASRSIESGDVVLVSLLPGMDRELIEAELLRQTSLHGRRGIASCLQALGLPERLADAVLEWSGVERSLGAASLDRSRRTRLVEAVAALPLVVERVGGFEEAMATSGGVVLAEVEPRTLASRIEPGLFFAGEILDLDGDTGGYNLQAAFSTGRLAGIAAAT